MLLNIRTGDARADISWLCSLPRGQMLLEVMADLYCSCFEPVSFFTSTHSRSVECLNLWTITYDIQRLATLLDWSAFLDRFLGDIFSHSRYSSTESDVVLRLEAEVLQRKASKFLIQLGTAIRAPDEPIHCVILNFS